MTTASYEFYDIFHYYDHLPNGRIFLRNDPISIEIHTSFTGYPTAATMHSCVVPRDVLLSGLEAAKPFLLSLLSEARIPSAHTDEMIANICVFSTRMNPLTMCGCGRFVMPVIRIMALVDSMEIDDGSQITLDPTAEDLQYINMFTPASKRAIEDLEKVANEGAVATDERCTICLEELGDGVQITKLPCSHIYHNDCIVQWLETSHLCPICRYKVSTI